jgi:hypothetical protein
MGDVGMRPPTARSAARRDTSSIATSTCGRSDHPASEIPAGWEPTSQRGVAIELTQPSIFIVKRGPIGRILSQPANGSGAWKARYGRRNRSESRNAQIEAVGLKRLPSSGPARGAEEVQVAGFVINLRTLGRLCREAAARYQRWAGVSDNPTSPVFSRGAPLGPSPPVPLSRPHRAKHPPALVARRLHCRCAPFPDPLRVSSLLSSQPADESSHQPLPLPLSRPFAPDFSPLLAARAPGPS